MGLIPEEHKEHLRNELSEKLVYPLRVLMFTQELECQFCRETRQLVQELASLNDKIEVEIHDFVANSEKAREYGIDKVPAVAIVGERDYGIRFYGFPYGYEFQSLIQSVVMVSRRKTDLLEPTKAKLKAIDKPIHIQVIVTLTCPHCAMAAVMAHKFAMENAMIKADVIDANEFPYLATKYGVMGVPKVVINEKIEFVGAVPENLFLDQVLLAVG